MSTTKGIIKFEENKIITKPFPGQKGFIEIWEPVKTPTNAWFHFGGRAWYLTSVEEVE